MVRGRQIQAQALILAAILLVCFVTFSPALRNDFVAWDDLDYIRDNSYIKDFSFQTIGRLFHLDTHVIGNYHPLTLLSFAAEYRFFKLDPYYYHLDNILLHVANTVLVYLLVLALDFSWPVAGAGSFIFAVHPMHVESVVWAAERKDVLSAMFLLLSLIGYARFVRRKSPFLLISSLFCFVLAVLSKAQAVYFPLLLPLIDYRLGRRPSLRQWLEKIPFFLGSLAFGIQAVRAQTFTAPPLHLPWGMRILTVAYAMARYLVKFIVPYPLSAYYPYPLSFGAGFYLVPLGVLLALTISLLLLGRQWKLGARQPLALFLFGASFYLAAILPVHGSRILSWRLIPAGDPIMADRYTYLAYLGPILVLAEACRSLLAHKPAARLMAGIPITIFLAMLPVMSYQRAKVWRNDLTLWENVVARYSSPVPLGCLGNAYFDAGRYTEAAETFQRLIALRPAEAANAWYALGNSYFKMRKYGEAVSAYRSAIKARRGIFPEAYYNLGTAYLRQGLTREAEECFAHASRSP